MFKDILGMFIGNTWDIWGIIVIDQPQFYNKWMGLKPSKYGWLIVALPTVYAYYADHRVPVHILFIQFLKGIMKLNLAMDHGLKHLESRGFTPSLSPSQMENNIIRL